MQNDETKSTEELRGCKYVIPAFVMPGQIGWRARLAIIGFTTDSMKELISSRWKLNPALLASALLVSLVLVGCEKKVKWQEEVKLSTGETFTIEREVKHEGGGAAWPQGQGSIPMEHLIRFRYPVKAGPLIEWRSTKLQPHGVYAELPLVLDISSDKTWFIFTVLPLSPGCDQYIKYQFRNGVWMEPKLAEVIESHPTNLFLAAGSNEIEGRISLAEKTQVNSSIGYRSRLKQVGPKRFGCNTDYNGPYPPEGAV